MRSSEHGRIEAVTLVAPDPSSMAEIYRRVLGQEEVGRHWVDRELGQTWGAPDTEGRQVVVLQPPSRCGFFLRWVEGTASAIPPRTTFGWAALELTVQDADALHRRLVEESEFRILGAPSPLPGLPQIYPMQAEGPAGEVLYLNEIRGQLPHHDLPVAQCEVDRVFIVVLGAEDLEGAVAFYAEELDFDLADAYEIPIGVVNEAFGAPVETRTRLQTLCVGRRVQLEVDQFPTQAQGRPTAAGDLPGAMAMVSFLVDDLEPHRSAALGPSIRRPEAPYLGREALVRRGAAGELVELIGTSSV